MLAFHHQRWFWSLVGVSLVALAMLRLCPLPAPDLSYDGSGYVEIANSIRASWSLPPLETRPPLYPLIVAVSQSLAKERALDALTVLQAVGWIVGALLTFGTVYSLLDRRVLPAAVAALLYCSMAEPVAYISRIYAEALAMTALLGSLFLFTVAWRRGDGARLPDLYGAAVLALAAAYLRPIFQLVLPLLGLAAFLEASISGASHRVRCLLPFALVALVGLGPWYGYHYVTRGSAFFVKTANLSLVNYLGDRRLLGHFAPEDRPIEQLYEHEFAARPNDLVVGWWRVYAPWLSSWQSPERPEDQFHAELGRVARRTLLRNPGYYVARWWEVWREYSTAAYDVPAGSCCPIAIVQPLWALFWRLCGVWAPAAIFVLELARARRTRSFLDVVPVALYLGLAIANTAIEPWPGQGRYRVPVQPLFLISLFALWPRPRIPRLRPTHRPWHHGAEARQA